MTPSAPTVQRLFLAVAVRSSPTLQSVLDRLAGMGPAVRPVAGHQLHITLKFYGNVADELVPAIIRGMNTIASAGESFAWQLQGIGAFPTPHRPRVVWAGAVDQGRLAATAASIEEFSEPMGFPAEQRPFTPHVTLARVKFRPPAALGELFQREADRDFGPQYAESIILYASQLGRAGPLYIPMHTAPFAMDRNSVTSGATGSQTEKNS